MEPRGPERRSSGGVASADKPARRYRGLDPDQRRADRRQRLLAAGLELFGTTGYHATTITGICREAGVTTAHFYEEFGGREALLWALFDDILTDTAGRVAAALVDAPLDLRAQSTAGLDAFLRSMLEDPRRGRVQCLETVGISPEFEARRRTLLRGYTAVVVNAVVGIAEADGRELPTTNFVAGALVAGVQEAVIEWLHLDDPPSIDEVVDELVELFEVVGNHYARRSLAP